ncbi:HNH endonuclease [Aeromicrobium sp. YC3-14]|nr:HNH endonuclease [Aeromicrobium stalagmiti]
MPKVIKITAKTATITNAFVNGLIPVVKPTKEQVEEALHILGMHDGPECAYCGDPMSEWDHLRPLIVDKQPTGHISEIHNLVPSCGKCNQSKGNKEWRAWMFGPAAKSPKSRGVDDIDARAARLVEYEAWVPPTVVQFGELLGSDVWDKHWQRHAQIIALMKEAQGFADVMRERIAETYLAELSKVDPHPGQIVARSGNGAAGADRFVVTTPVDESVPLAKSHAVLALVRALSHAVPCSTIRAALSPATFRPVDGTLSGDALWNAFTSAHDIDRSKRSNWFINSPIHQDGNTWVLASNVWGKRAEDKMRRLTELGPGWVSFHRHGDSVVA